jgi:hypothetical protein
MCSRMCIVCVQRCECVLKDWYVFTDWYMCSRMYIVCVRGCDVFEDWYVLRDVGICAHGCA